MNQQVLMLAHWLAAAGLVPPVLLVPRGRLVLRAPPGLLAPAVLAPLVPPVRLVLPVPLGLLVPAVLAPLVLLALLVPPVRPVLPAPAVLVALRPEPVRQNVISDDRAAAVRQGPRMHWTLRPT